MRAFNYLLTLFVPFMVLWPLYLFAQNNDLSKVEIKVAKVSGNVYMLQGQGGNIAALVGEDGIAIIDDQFEPLAEKISKALQMLGITNKPVSFVINTHYHGDHTGGNVPFSKTATIVAHENVRKRLMEAGASGNGNSLRFERKPSAKEALPVITFEDKLTIHLNGEEVQAIHFPRGHTDTDSVIFFKKANVVHTGDDFVAGFPFIDVLGGGSLDGLIANLTSLIEKLPADVKIIPGHGPISDLDDMKEFKTMILETRDLVVKSLGLGKTLEDMKKEHLLSPWEEKYGQGFIKADQFLESIVYSLNSQAK